MTTPPSAATGRPAASAGHTAAGDPRRWLAAIVMIAILGAVALARKEH